MIYGHDHDKFWFITHCVYMGNIFFFFKFTNILANQAASSSRLFSVPEAEAGLRQLHTDSRTEDG